jgi:heme-degrading monooxygenase HmoA
VGLDDWLYSKEDRVIGRIWHGWTTPHNADKYEKLLKEEIFSGIAEKKVSGYKRIQLFRRPLDNDEVEFVTIMWFDSWDAVKQFAGEDYERAYVPAAARRCCQGSTSAPNTMRSGKASNIRSFTRLGASPKSVIFGPPAADFREPPSLTLGE